MTALVTFLLPQHAALISASAIAPDVADARGYRSVTTKSQLAALGFGVAQRRVPALLLPIHGVAGEIAGYHIRPDVPRVRPGKSKPIKYEFVAGSRMVLDVPPGARPWIGEPSRPLFVTEGVRKADAAVSAGLCCVALLGVWNWRGTNADGGKVALPDWESVALNDRDVYIVFDSDVSTKDSVHEAMVRLRDFLAHRGARVRIVYLPAGEGATKVGLDDFFAAGGYVDRLLSLASDEIRSAPITPTGSARAEPSPRPRIVISHDVHAMVDAVDAALLEARSFFLFQQSGRLVEPVRDGHGASEGAPREGAMVLREVRLDRLVDIASRHMEWMRVRDTSGGIQEVIARPDKDTLRAYLARPQWRLRYLRGIVQAPSLRPDGSVIDRPGYDSATGLLMADTRTQYPEVPAAPTLEDAHRAVAELCEVVSDFPFLTLSDRSAWIASVLTLLSRHAIDGPVPMVLVRSPTPGTGKTLLVQIASLIALGQESACYPQTGDPEEDRKTILSIAMAGDPLVLFDNVSATFGSPALDSALTTQSVTGRVLGTNHTPKAPFYAVVYATGNNLQIKGDLARRVIVVDVDSELERPEEERNGFRHDNIRAWVRQERPRLVAAALTILKGYIAAGRPRRENLPLLGSFEAWDAMVRGALMWCGEADPAEGRARIREESSPELDAHRELLEAWKDAVGFGVPVSIARLIEIGHEARPNMFNSATQHVGLRLRAALAALNSRMDPERLDARMIGYAFRRFKDRVVDGMKITGGHARGGVQWQLVPKGGGGGVVSPPAGPCSCRHEPGEDLPEDAGHPIQPMPFAYCAS